MFGSSNSLMFCIVMDACDEEEETKKQNFLISGRSYIPKMTITPKDPAPFSHRGIDVEFCVEVTQFNQKPVKTILTSTRVSESDTITEIGEYTLSKVSIDQYTQTYHGALFTVKYYFRVWVKKLFGSEFFEKEVIVYRVVTVPKLFEPLFVAISISDALRVEVLIKRRNYDLDDIIMGAIRYSIVRIDVARVFAQLIAQETIEMNGKTEKFDNTVGYWEIATGSPVKGEIIPFRFYMNPLHLTPSSSNPKFGYSITHLIHMTFITPSGNKYFKDFHIKVMKMNRLSYGFINEPPRIIDKQALLSLQERINREKEPPKFLENIETSIPTNDEDTNVEEEPQEPAKPFILPMREPSDMSSSDNEPQPEENLTINENTNPVVSSQASIALTSVGDDGTGSQPSLIISHGDDNDTKKFAPRKNHAIDMKKIDDDFNALLDEDEIELQNLDEPEYNPFE